MPRDTEVKAKARAKVYRRWFNGKVKQRKEIRLQVHARRKAGVDTQEFI